MTPSEEDLFAQALEQPEAARERFVAGAARDAAERERILVLLRAHAKAEQVLRPIQARVAAESAASEGTVIGRYKLLEKIGEGGCGEVWMAQQEDPVRRRVALKVIKPGMDTKEVIARFEAERQALALMEHPHIAKVFDAGATEGGRPYFVMELVHGHAITRYCDERRLGTTERLGLFVQVCRALQHAHEKGIVHRDIKPSNILVTRDGDLAVPKVIDFGIAKATQGRLTDQTLFTAFDQFIGTPAYMSPEQADLAAQEVDARSDVYSLGALLYELLAGRPPFDPKTLAATGIEEVRRIIREVDPPRPSTQLHTLSPVERTTLAERRGVVPTAHAEAVTGDLDWITMKALEKNRIRRYASAAELAADVDRFLAQLPVSARPPSWGYVAGKYFHRHHVALTAAAIGGALATIGGLVIFLQTRRAERAEQAHASLAAELAVDAGNPPPGAPPAVAPPSRAALAAARDLAARLRDNFFAELPTQERVEEIDGAATRALTALGGVPAAERTPALERENLLLLSRATLAHRRRLKQDLALRTAALMAAIEKLPESDRDEDTLIVRACALAVRFDGDPQRVDTAARDGLRQAAALLRPLAVAAGGSIRARVHLAEVLAAQANQESGAAALQALQEARDLVESLDPGTRRRPDLQLLRGRIFCLLWKTNGTRSGLGNGWLGEVLGLADEVLRARPGSIEAFRLRRSAFVAEGGVAGLRRQFAAEFTALVNCDQAATEIVRRDPMHELDWQLLVRIRESLARAHREAGRIEAAATTLRDTVTDGRMDLTTDKPPTKPGRRFLRTVLLSLALLEADRGNATAARRAAAARLKYTPYVRDRPGMSTLANHLLRPTLVAMEEYQLSLRLAADAEVIEKGRTTYDQLVALLRRPEATDADRVVCLPVIASLQEYLARAHLHLGQWAEAEAVLNLPPDLKPTATSTRLASHARWLGLALARQGHGPEALSVVADSQGNLRRRVERKIATLAERQDFALGLFVEALAQPATDAGRARRQAGLIEAQKIVDAIPEGARQLHQARLLQGWLSAERARD